ncbi:MAG: 2Fe-2S iron-sulfur cluster-binding protein [Gammaproteobacteria bacterium]|nr:2Fe-2S iron-sulfur cluster-binding protein [Gammaproteobacteria bacterium]
MSPPAAARRGFFPVAIRSIVAETGDSRVIELSPLQDQDRGRITHRSGQHVSVRVTAGGREIYRTYSICEPSSSGKIALGVRLLPNGVLSDWLRRCKAGDRLAVSGAQGRFYLRPPEHPRQQSLFIASGSGITPVISMLEEFLGAYPEAGALLLYANRNTASTMFLERLMQLKNRFMARFTLHFFTSREQQAVAWRNSRIDAAALGGLQDKRLLRVPDFRHFYLCGPPPMMESCGRFLRAGGVDGARIHSEHFAPARRLDASDSPQPQSVRGPDPAARIVARVSVILNGTRREFNYCDRDPSVLAAAARQHIALPFACAGGVCGTCRCKILQGRVLMEKNHALEAQDIADGFVLACQSRPQDGKLSLSFDY